MVARVSLILTVSPSNARTVVARQVEIDGGQRGHRSRGREQLHGRIADHYTDAVTAFLVAGFISCREWGVELLEIMEKHRDRRAGNVQGYDEKP